MAKDAVKGANLSKQYGVIPFLEADDCLQVVMIRSRTNGFWIFPKGNPMPGLSKYETAAREAFEEAGVSGTVIKTPCCKVMITTKRGQALLTLYPMAVEKIHRNWPERDARERIILPTEAAEKNIAFDSLRTCLRQWKNSYI
ncbi:MAG: NUDIX hydrolase [Desulfobacterales bacterium]|nr:NUDIX hydrolase [Desulfobacterales bacterium]